MKPRYVTASIIVAILATVAIEETRVSKLRGEITRLRSLREQEAARPDIAAESEPIASTPAPAKPAVEAPAPPVAAAKTGRVPEGFPEPDEDRIKALALGPRAILFQDLGLDDHERAYLEHLIESRDRTEAEFAGRWMAAAPADRAAIEDALGPEIDEYNKDIASFLQTEAALAIFTEFQEKRAERAMVDELRPLMDQKGVALALAKEQQLVEALHQARLDAGMLKWDSPEALPVIAEGGGPEKFESQWDAQTEALAAALPDFLTEKEAAAVLAARAELKGPRLESVQLAAEALAGEQP